MADHSSAIVSRTRGFCNHTALGTTFSLSSVNTSMAQQARPSTFIEELRRRRVFRVAAFYGGIAFVIVQIIDGTFEVMGIPAWVSRLLITFLALGFPVAIGLAWVFDITPEGIVRTGSRSADKPGTSNRALISVTIAAVAFGIWGWMRDGGSTVGEIRSIAVLPLENLMNDPSQDYFVSGMHEALTAELSRISALRVIGRTSTMSYKANPKPISEIAAELNVDAVIEGSVLRDGERVRIMVQLVATRPERHLWSESYERNLVDIIALQNEVAAAIAREIKITMTPGERSRLADRRKVSLEAHDHYLKGLFYWNKRSRDGFDLALSHFQASTIADPNFAPALAGLALTYQLLGEYSIMPITDSAPKAIFYAEQALGLDPDLAEAHTALAAARLYYQYDWARAEAGYKKAIAINPGYATAYQWLGELDLFLGRKEDALAHVNKALSLDPLSNAMRIALAIILTSMGRYDEAIAQHEEREKLYPEITVSLFWYVNTLIQAGRIDDAVELDLKLLRHFADPPGADGELLRASYEKGGFDSYASECISIMKKNGWDSNPDWVVSVSWRLARTGDAEATLTSLEKDVIDRGFLLPFINFIPEFDFLSDEPRFQAILSEIGLAR